MSDHRNYPANALINTTSPYLLQHAYNPVKWLPWSDEAFEKAREEDKPIFLSVGYSTCHWCHVMAHESFEDEEVAAILNNYFVPIKVDREERPDIDTQYMIATQVFTRRGGWPNSVWLTPDGRPWMAGTYFPKNDTYGRMGFISVLEKLHDAWTDNRKDIEAQANEIAKAIRSHDSMGSQQESVELSRKLIDSALTHLQSTFDAVHAGFGRAPKFPPHASMHLMLTELKKSENPTLKTMAQKTLRAMALGGIHDHLGGGFHRYSTDAQWLVPHFEKMLYDNGQLLRAYAQSFELEETPYFKSAANGIVDWLEREMTDETGGFYSALDADSEGVEGKCYVWTQEEIIAILGKEDGELFNEIYQIMPDGNWYEEATGEKEETNIPHLRDTLDTIAIARKQDPSSFITKIIQMKNTLLHERSRRIQPHLDDKILTSWNGIMIASLAEAGRVFKNTDMIHMAEEAADFIFNNMFSDQGRLLRVYRKGHAHTPAYLDDFVYFIDGLLALYEATYSQARLDQAVKLTHDMCMLFEDQLHGGFFESAGDHETLLLRSKNPTAGGNTPSTNAIAARVLLKIARLTEHMAFAQTAKRTLLHFSGLMEEHPYLSEELLNVASDWLDAPLKTERETNANHRIEHIPTEIMTYLSHPVATPGQNFYVLIRMTLENDWHIYGHNADALGMQELELTATENDNFTIIRKSYPRGTGEEKELSGSFDMLLYMHLSDEAPIGEDIPLNIRLKYQACGNGHCLPADAHQYVLKIRTTDQGDNPLQHVEIFEALGT